MSRLLWPTELRVHFYFLEMVAVEGFEPPTSRVWTVRSSQLSYTASLSLVSYIQKWWILTGSNRRPPACKTGALPAELRTHKNIWSLVPKAGIEPARYCYHRILSPARLPIPPLRQFKDGVSGTIRTSDPLIKSQLLYLLSYGDNMVPTAGIEPATYWLQVNCSTNWAKSANGGEQRARTADPLLVRQMLSQLS